VLPLELSLDDFVQFLVDHASDVVGFSGLSFFHNPLAEWLAASCGCLVSVDTDQYGHVSSGRSYPLPGWARRLASWLDACTYGVPLTGEMVFSALSSIEVGAPLPRL
jgi:hypothetical protein